MNSLTKDLRACEHERAILNRLFNKITSHAPIRFSLFTLKEWEFYITEKKEECEPSSINPSKPAFSVGPKPEWGHTAPPQFGLILGITLYLEIKWRSDHLLGRGSGGGTARICAMLPLVFRPASFSRARRAATVSFIHRLLISSSL